MSRRRMTARRPLELVVVLGMALGGTALLAAPMASADDTAVTAGNGTPLPLAAGDPAAPNVPPHPDDGASAPPVTVPTPVAPTPTTPPDAEPVSGSTTGAGPTTTVAPSPPATPPASPVTAPREEPAPQTDRPTTKAARVSVSPPVAAPAATAPVRSAFPGAVSFTSLTSGQPVFADVSELADGANQDVGVVITEEGAPPPTSPPTQPPPTTPQAPAPLPAGATTTPIGATTSGGTTGAETAQGSLPVTGLDDATLRLAGIGLLLLDVGYLMWSVTRPARSRRSSALLA